MLLYDIIHFHPSQRAEVGYSYGFLLSAEIRLNYLALTQSVFGRQWYEKVSRSYAKGVVGHVTI